MQLQNNKIDFTGQNIYVGIDVHLKSWKVTVMTEKLFIKTFSQAPCPEQLSRFLKRNFPNAVYHSAYEAGFCGYWIHNRLLTLGINSIVVNAADIPTTDKEKTNKNDKRDSRKIAKSLQCGYLNGIYVPSLKTLEDRNLLRVRSAIVQDLIRNKNRIKSFLYFHGIVIPERFQSKTTHWSKKYIDWLRNLELSELSAQKSLLVMIHTLERLRATLLTLTQDIRDLSKSEAYCERSTLLQSLPGIGTLTAMIILTEIETMERFSNFNQLCSFVGLVPTTKSSGEKNNIGEITERGNNFLRNMIIECAWIAVRRDLSLNKSYHEYCKRMEPSKAIIRIARKLLRRIRFVLKNNQPYKCFVVE